LHKTRFVPTAAELRGIIMNIKLIAGLGGAAFGGYGWANRRRRADEEEN